MEVQLLIIVLDAVPRLLASCQGGLQSFSVWAFLVGMEALGWTVLTGVKSVWEYKCSNLSTSEWSLAFVRFPRFLVGVLQGRCFIYVGHKTHRIIRRKNRVNSNRNVRFCFVGFFLTTRKNSFACLLVKSAVLGRLGCIKALLGTSNRYFGLKALKSFILFPRARSKLKKKKMKNWI